MRSFLVLPLALVALAACSVKRAGALDGRPIEVVVPTEATMLDPRFATRSLDVKVTRLIHAGLSGLDPGTLEPVPLVAEAFQWQDARTLRVTLRHGVVFHSGRPLTPGDVCATLEAVRAPVTSSPHRSIVEAIAHCTPDGERTLTLQLGAPRATLLSDLEIPILRADEAWGAPRADGTLDGLGPFAIASARPGEITLTPAATNVAPRPRHAIVVRTVRDENARVQRLLAGRSDVAPNAVSPALLPALEGREGLEVVSRRGANVTYLLFQNERAPFDRADVRRAVAGAIDRALVARTLLAGRATAATGLLPPGHWAFAEAPAEAFDPARARSVLAGLPPSSLLSTTERARTTVARAVAQMLGDAGLMTAVVPLDLGVMLARLDAGDFEMAILQIPELTEPNVLRWFFHAGGVPGEGRDGKNRARYRSAIVADLFDRAAASPDRTVRAELYREVSRQMAADLPVVPLWHEDQVAVVSTRARGFRPSAEGRWLTLAGLE